MNARRALTAGLLAGAVGASVAAAVVRRRGGAAASSDPHVAIVELRGRLRRRERRLLRRFHRDVLVPSFPPDELQTIDDLLAGLRSEAPATVAQVAVDQRGRPVGGLVLDWDPDIRVLLAAYLAVRPDLRGHGVGSRLEAALGAASVAAYRPLLFLGEAQDPRHHGVVDGIDPDARLRLFERLGLRLLATPYLTPRLHDDRPRAGGMLLLAYHVDDTVLVRHDGGEAVPASLVAAHVRRALATCEGEAVLTDDPEVAALLTHLEGRDLIPLLPATAYDRVPTLST